MRFVFAALALAALGLLGDAAVETWLGGSALREWIAAGIALAALPLAILWRDAGWALRAGFAFLVLLGAIAAAAWAPGGLSDGIAMLRQDPATVRWGAAAAAVLVALPSFLLARRARRPWFARLGSLVFVAVGAAALAPVWIVPGVEIAVPASELRDTDASIELTITSTYTEPVPIEARWTAVEAEGVEAGEVVHSEARELPPGETIALGLPRPKQGFVPGRYRVEVSIDGEAQEPVEIRIDPLYPDAPPSERAEVPRGFNLALATFGGRIVTVTSQYDDAAWAARNLIDGAGLRVEPGRFGNRCVRCGWSSSDATTPQEIVFAFRGDREARIGAVLVDNVNWLVQEKPDELPRDVEVWTSTTGADEGYTQAGGARLPRRAGEYAIGFPPRRARFVKLRILSNHGGAALRAGEVKIVEAADDAGSILAGVTRNLAAPELGGVISRASSQYDGQHSVSKLVDGRTDDEGWCSRSDYLPQEVVLAFRGDRVAQVERVVVTPPAATSPADWPRRLSIAVSTRTPFDGFEEVGSFEMTQEPGPQAFELRRPARFLKLRILENHGGRFTRLGEVEVIEAETPGADSVLLEPGLAVADARGGEDSGPGAEPADADPEAERNDDPPSANPLAMERFKRGTIDPLGESDYFAFDVPPNGRSVLTLDLLGRPYIRTSLALFGPGGAVRKHFDPGRRPGEARTFSWLVDAGPHQLRVTEPPVSIVLVWDTSGSMEGRSEDLRAAVASYLAQVQPSERLALIRFSDRVEVLQADFTNDPRRLQAAAEGKFFASGGTPLYDALQRAIELLAGVSGNRAIIVMTDGEDSGSRLDYPGFWTLLDEKRVRVYTIGLGIALESNLPNLGTTSRRLLGHVALATNGRAFATRSSEELTGLYQEIAQELRTLSTYYLRPSLSRGPGSLEVAATGERIARTSAPQFELILDASGSMIERRRKIDGRFKMDVARDVAIGIVEELPDGAPVAFRVYGRRIRENRPGDCQDSELLFPFGPVDKPRLTQSIREIQALGTTPLAYSLEQAARDFGDAPGEKVLILVTDGKEECDGDPTAVVRQLADEGLDVRVNVVGFALAEEAVKQEMERVAEITGGEFFDAQDAAGLREAIEKSLAVPYDVLDAEGETVASGLTGAAAALPEGVYTVRVRSVGEPIVVPDVRIVAGDTTRVELEKEGQEVGVHVIAAAP